MFSSSSSCNRAKKFSSVGMEVSIPPSMPTSLGLSCPSTSTTRSWTVVHGTAPAPVDLFCRNFYLVSATRLDHFFLRLLGLRSGNPTETNSSDICRQFSNGFTACTDHFNRLLVILSMCTKALFVIQFQE